MKKKLNIALSIAIIFSLCFMLDACGNKSDNDDSATKTAASTEVAEDQTETETTNVEASQLASQATEMNKSEDNFLGTWEATSENAEYYYGHLSITINEDGTFDADVTDEVFSGTWSKIDGGIKYESEFMNGTLFYGKKCRMVIEDSDIYVTLEKVN